MITRFRRLVLALAIIFTLPAFAAESAAPRERVLLDAKHYADEPKRSWLFRTVGYGHGEEVWRDMISTLRMIARMP